MSSADETPACGVTPEEFERFTRYCNRGDNHADNIRRARLLGFDGNVRIAPGAIVRIGGNAIGENSFIGLYCYVNGDVRIGRNVLIGPHCSLPASNHRFDIESQSFAFARDVPRPITIGDGSWLASGVTVTNGVTVGKANLVCAGAVVTRDTPDYAIMAGAPARRIGEIDPATGEYRWFGPDGKPRQTDKPKTE